MFDVLINDAFVKFAASKDLTPIDRKSLLSLFNDFEDGHWRLEKFQNFIWDNIAETSLTARERASLLTQSHSKLKAAARNLRLTDTPDDVGNASELAEIVLYGVMKHQFGALPVVPKIFYKQNVNDNAKGADSVHIVLDDKGDFALWFGEAKFYSSIEDARLGSVVKSVGESLRTDKLKKENSIITNLSDINDLVEDSALRERIKAALSPANSIDNLKSRIHVAVLLLHECGITKVQTELTESYKSKLKKYHLDRANAYFAKQIAALKGTVKYEDIHFHLIVFPVPNKKIIVEQFLNDVTHFKKKSHG